MVLLRANLACVRVLLIRLCLMSGVVSCVRGRLRGIVRMFDGVVLIGMVDVVFLVLVRELVRYPG